MKILRLLLLATPILLSSLPAVAVTVEEAMKKITVPNSYIVTFKQSTTSLVSPVLPPRDLVRTKHLETLSRQFGIPSSGQDKASLAVALGLRGEVGGIFDHMNAAHLKMNATEAERLRKDPRVLRVDPDLIYKAQESQYSPGWALDRIDQTSGALDGSYTYNSDGAGRLLVVMDSGLDLTFSGVANEFKDLSGNQRAAFVWDVNNNGGKDCYGHGTAVASIAAGRQYGVAKGAIVKIFKITQDQTSPTFVCGETSSTATQIQVLDFLTSVAPVGTVVNYSYGLQLGFCYPAVYDLPLEDAFKRAYAKGIILVVAAGNDGCDVGNFSPSNLAEAFVVGGTTQAGFPSQDWRWVNGALSTSRYGANISTFAPADGISALAYYGLATVVSGTSYAAPAVAGLILAACQYTWPYCDTAANPGVVYGGMRSFGVLGNVKDPGGVPLPGSTPSRFINRAPW